MLKIGVMPSSFRIPFKDAVIKARDMGAKGLQPYVTSGELDPDNLSSDDRRDILKFVRENGLCFSALCADFGMDFSAFGENDADIKRTMKMMDLAVDFDTHIITTHIGHVPDDENSTEYKNICKQLKLWASTEIRSEFVSQPRQDLRRQSSCAEFLKKPTRRAQR